MSDTQDDKTPLNWHNLITGLAVAAICFAAAQFFSNREDMAVLKTQLTGLQTVLTEVRGDLKQLRDTGVQRQEYEKLEARVTKLENR